jgi:hypothetical protein
MPTTTSIQRRHKFYRIEGFQNYGSNTWQFTKSGQDSNIFTDTVTKGDNLSNWRFLIANGLDATTSLSGMRRSVVCVEGHLFRSLKAKAGADNGNRAKYRADGQLVIIGPPGAGDSSLFTAANNQAITSFLSKCYDEQRAFQALVTAGELGEALRMIKSPAQALRNGLNDYLLFLRGKRGRVPKNRRRQFLSETWLEYMFGWRPLISDIQAGFEAVARYHHQLKPWRMVRANGVAFGNSQWSEGQDNFSGGITIRFKTHALDEYNVKYYGLVTVLNPNGHLPNMRNWGADWRSFAPSVWNLIPYSFLVDYFTNIGDVISSFAFNQADLRWKVRGTRNSRTIESIDERVVPSTDPTFVTVADVGTPGKMRWVRADVTRGSIQGVLVPTLSFNIPGMTSLKWLNMAALARLSKSIIPF